MALGKLSKAEEKQLSSYQDSLRQLVDDFQEFCKEPQEVKDEEAFVALRDNVDARLEKLNSVCEEAAEFLEGIHDDQDSQAQDKSEKWQEGDRGQAVMSWLEELSDKTSFDAVSVDLEAPVSYPVELDLQTALEVSAVYDFCEALENVVPSAEG
jgi:hypothetical protein